MSLHNNKFGKRYSLSSQKTIENIFSSGITIKGYPFVAIVKETKFKDRTPFKLVFSAPKKKFRHATTRNRIKRICREAIRNNKRPLEEYLLSNNKQLAIFLIYSSKEEIKFELLQRKTQKLIKTLIKTLDDNKN